MLGGWGGVFAPKNMGEGALGRAPFAPHLSMALSGFDKRFENGSQPQDWLQLTEDEVEGSEAVGLGHQVVHLFLRLRREVRLYK